MSCSALQKYSYAFTRAGLTRVWAPGLEPVLMPDPPRKDSFANANTAVLHIGRFELMQVCYSH